MCGIVGLFLKDKSLELRLGEMLTDMLVTMSDRGPDSAGIAIYKSSNSSYKKITLQSSNPTKDFKNLKTSLDKLIHQGLEISIIDTHAIINFETKYLEKVKALLSDSFSCLKIMSIGDSIEIYKEVGSPETVANRFHLSKMIGSHGIGHTRMATESAVTTMGAHPFSTGNDQCLVHNGSLSNHNSLRRKLIRNGIKFETDNDTEVAAGYISNKLSKNKSLEKTLKNCLTNLDGFYTFIAGTNNGFAVLRDEIACKPAVIAENKDYVAVASEFQAMAHLPNVNNAKIYEPEPGVIYTWGK